MGILDEILVGRILGCQGNFRKLQISLRDKLFFILSRMSCNYSHVLSLQKCILRIFQKVPVRSWYGAILECSGGMLRESSCTGSPAEPIIRRLPADNPRGPFPRSVCVLCTFRPGTAPQPGSPPHESRQPTAAWYSHCFTYRSNCHNLDIRFLQIVQPSPVWTRPSFGN